MENTAPKTQRVKKHQFDINPRFEIYFYLLPVIVLIPLIIQYAVTRYKPLLPDLLRFTQISLVAFVLASLFTPIMIQIAKKLKITDKNGNKTPLLGGSALFLTIITVILINPTLITPQMIAILAGATIIYLVGTLDDIRLLSSVFRLVAQTSAAVIVMSAGLIFSFLPKTWWGTILAWALTWIWILGIVNATNFMDGVDGLASGMAGIAALFFMLITAHLEQYPVALISAVVFGACGGFLLFNFKPAKIYLGDGGSTLLGFLIACIALYGKWSTKGPLYAFSVPLLILATLIFDMIYITVSRFARGKVETFREWLDFVGRDHFHHRLINIGFRPENAVFFIYLISVILGLNALAIENAPDSYTVVNKIVQTILMFIIVTMLMLVGRKDIHEPPKTKTR